VRVIYKGSGPLNDSKKTNAGLATKGSSFCVSVPAPELKMIDARHPIVHNEEIEMPHSKDTKKKMRLDF
jgi:hypothetical protein